MCRREKNRKREIKEKENKENVQSHREGETEEEEGKSVITDYCKL